MGTALDRLRPAYDRDANILDEMFIKHVVLSASAYAGSPRSLQGGCKIVELRHAAVTIRNENAFQADRYQSAWLSHQCSHLG